MYSYACIFFLKKKDETVGEKMRESYALRLAIIFTFLSKLI